MKTVEEMIRSKTPEEWRKIIDEEIEKLNSYSEEEDANFWHFPQNDEYDNWPWDEEVNNKE